jgi:hypothetical protein
MPAGRRSCIPLHSRRVIVRRVVGRDQPRISPLHTHDGTGIIHTESTDPEPNTLGQFFVEWCVELSVTCVGEHCAPTPIAVYSSTNSTGLDVSRGESLRPSA